jgi:NAD(P)-dependent dehydrogenase (short-subunit alcohol dehydrogenase family)
VDLELADRVVVVTGGSSGIGLETVRLLHEEGAFVATCARDLGRLAAAVSDLGFSPERVLTHAADIRDTSQVAGFIKATLDRFGRIDGLVNNAGRSLMKPLADTSAREWKDEIELKFHGLLNPTCAALEALRASGRGAIVNVNAVLAVQPEGTLAATSAARAGVLNLSKSMAAEYARDGIRVNSVCLGLIDTGQWRRRYQASGEPGDYAGWQRKLAADRRIPLGRLGRAEEVAALVVFLLSARASYITGAAYDVAGGLNRGVH